MENINIILFVSLLVTAYSCETARPVGRIVKMGSLENLLKDQVVPDVIDKKPATTLRVTYPSGAQVHQGNELTPSQVKDLPKFNYVNRLDKLYTLMMVDPDAPTRVNRTQEECVHMLIVNIPAMDVSKGETLVEYVGSAPPKGSGLHRYVFLLFEQQKKIVSEMKISKNSAVGRRHFSSRDFAKKHNLELTAANFYQAEYDDFVPTIHKQLGFQN